ncbi:hypothetical protein [Vibrio vulnificus]|uniref:hypothetical protein n=2 Tax=Vibrio vulnificus TaxID=672 RepID=UPI001DC2BB28|nr:hypothetical protein [Vibrio vulnificus]
MTKFADSQKYQFMVVSTINEQVRAAFAALFFPKFGKWRQSGDRALKNIATIHHKVASEGVTQNMGSLARG